MTLFCRRSLREGRNSKALWLLRRMGGGRGLILDRDNKGGKVRGESKQDGGRLAERTCLRALLYNKKESYSSCFPFTGRCVCVYPSFCILPGPTSKQAKKNLQFSKWTTGTRKQQKGQIAGGCDDSFVCAFVCFVMICFVLLVLVLL